MITDDVFIEQLKKGDEAGFQGLYQRYSEGLLRHLFFLLGNKEEAEEVLHECMMLMIQKINFYEPRTDLKNSFKSWLYRLSTNRAIDEIRKRKAKMQPEENNIPSAESSFAEKENETIISDLLLKLPLIQRTVLSLRVHEDLSYMEISLICGKDINTVKQGLFQARKSLKALMLDHGEIL